MLGSAENQPWQNLCDHNTSTSQTDRQMTCHGSNAVKTRNAMFVHRKTGLNSKSSIYDYMPRDCLYEARVSVVVVRRLVKFEQRLQNMLSCRARSIHRCGDYVSRVWKHRKETICNWIRHGLADWPNHGLLWLVVTRHPTILCPIPRTRLSWPPVGLPSLLAASGGHRIFIYICGQYGIQKNIYIYIYIQW